MNGRILALGLLFAIAGCNRSGAEPSQDEIRAALKQANYRGGPQAEKLACKSSPERPGVVCDYRAPACNRYTGTCGSVKPFTGRFLESNGRWQLVEDLTPRAQQDPVTQPLPGVVPTTPVATPTPDLVDKAIAAGDDAQGAAPASAPTEDEAAAAPPPAPVPPRVAPPRPPRFDDRRDDPDRDDMRPRGGGDDLSIGELSQTTHWLSLNTRCNMPGPRSYDNETACQDRDRLERRLERRGLCRTDRGWRRC